MKISRGSLILSISVWLGLVFGLTVLGRDQSSGTEQPIVVSAAAPVYPALANAARIEGDAFVEAKIDAAGVVIAARAEGHALLRDACEFAAKRWRFASVEGYSGNRTARLTFSFRVLQKEMPSNQITPVFYPPYRVEVTTNPSIVQTVRSH
ncbi:MAG TPA: energy transducer TonB [Blastocatellia bacterium]|nr:energy transducer TonB [Blastocatellia bacterium]